MSRSLPSFWLFPFFFGITIAAACAPTPSEFPSVGESPSPQQPPSSDFLPPAVLAARQALADRLNVPPAEVRIRKVEQVDWPDACLGIETPGMMCAQVITPGFRVLLEAAGKIYEFRTNLDGSHVRLARPANFEGIDGK
ncbi:MAG: hypothetical protein RML93_13355 [Anaerolineales bacterium]|nr:hypothetical protein [Anaerolineales bacterium]MCS7247399.1 hypothetical protein [Anaerolineales bacterium]MDW8161210.1 hypothetical protein [Anaerolineales bacterium]MDW8448260.1 hypothetical protein [Anaerolineales bacterium]